MAAPGRTPASLVLIAGTDPREDLSGHRTYVRAHALAATEAGFSPHLFCVGRRSEVDSTEFGVVHQIASPLRPHTLLAAAHHPVIAGRVMSHLRSQPGPHLIHSFGPWAMTGAATSRAMRRRGVPAIAVASAYTTLEHESAGKRSGLGPSHDTTKALGYRASRLWVRAVASRCERRGYGASRLLLVNYDSVRHLLLDLCGPELEIRRLPYATPAAFRPEDKDPGATVVPDPIARLRPVDAPLIVSVSRHDPRKGVDVLLRALAGLAADGVRFRACLVGRGPLLQAHRRQTAALGLNDSVAITGYVEDAFAYLRQADVFALPSLEEGGGSLALIEALQAGAAVVASRCDGISEDLIADRDAILVSPGKAPALQTALGKLLSDSALRERLRAGARGAYETKFSAATFAHALAATYGELGFFPD